MTEMDLTCLSYWFPKIQAAGIPVPKTTVIAMPRSAQLSLFGEIFDGRKLNGDERPFLADIKAAADQVGYPAFLRTGHTSGKHDWDNTCFLSSADQIEDHVLSLMEFSELADFVGLPSDIWAVREFLLTTPVATLPRYGNMPLCREFRFFVEGGKVECWHPYWPLGSIEQGGLHIDEATAAFKQMSDIADLAPLFEIAIAASKAVEGRWSVDLLETTRGWYLIDMAEADKSFHYDHGDHPVVLAAEPL